MKLIISSLKRNALKPITVFVALTGALLVLSKAQTDEPRFIVPFVASGPAPKVSIPTPNYTVTSSTGASIVPGDTDIGNHTDDDTTAIILPFPVILYDQVFTTANVSSNGNLQFNSNSARFGNGCLPDGNFSYTIFPYWDDLYTGSSGEGVFTSVTGTAPNRIFNIEWRAEHCCFFGATSVNFEIRLYEGLRKFDIIYGSPLENNGFGGDGVTQTVGVQADDGTHFTQYECNTGGTLSTGLQLTFETPPSCASAPAGMIAWWKGEGNATDSQDDHNGTINDATFAPGEVGQAFTFDGTDDSVSIPDSNDWNFGTGDLTFDFWEKSSDTDRISALAFDPNQGTSNLDFDFNDTFGLWVFWNSGGGTNGVHAIQVGSPGDYTNDQWHHIALTRSGSTFTLYIDGVNVGTANDSEAINLSGANNNFIGRDIGGFFWNGQIDEVEVFKHALTAAEVASIYIAGRQGKCPCTSPPDHMVSWWRGEGDAVDTQDGNDGTFNGTPSYGSGEVAEAFSFNGNAANYVSVPPNTNLDLTAFTVDAWIYVTAYGSPAEFILDKEDLNAGNANYALSLTTDDFGNPNRAEILFDNASVGHQYVDSTFPIPLNTWTHLTGSYDGTILKLYINGVLNNSKMFGTTPIASGQPLFIGRRNNDTAYAFQGLVDEVEVFSRALTDAEVLAIYSAGGAGKCRTCTKAPGGMISWWPGNGNGTDVEDGNNLSF